MKLQQLIDHARNVYGRRNSVEFRGTPDRIGFLLVSIGDLHDAIKKSREKAVIAHMLGRVLSRIFCVVDAYKSLPLVETLARKYPLTVCSYCQKSPCVCTANRPDYSLVDVASKDQLEWSLQKWCQGFKRIYGDKNGKRDPKSIIADLYKETIELLAPAARPETIRGDLWDVEREIALEMADVLAWTIAISNYYGINLEKTYLGIYGNGCPKCRCAECRCAGFRYGLLDWGRYVPVAASISVR